MSYEYYLQDSRQMVGNCMLWWGKGRSGYVTDLREAHVFSEEEKKATAVRDTDVWWIKQYIDRIAGMTVDVQKASKRYSTGETR